MRIVRKGCVAVAACLAIACGPKPRPEPSVADPTIPKAKIILEGSSLLIVNEADESEPVEIHFEYDSEDLSPKSHDALNTLAQFLNRHTELTLIEVHGHTDERGSPEYNKTLSAYRANAVIQYLIAKGVDRKRLLGRGFGSSRPAEQGTSEDALRRNRRVEFVIASRSVE